MSQANLPNMTAGQLACFAFETITVSSSVKQLTAATLEDSDGKAKRVVITIQDAQIRWRYDGTDPTASVGNVSNPFDVIVLQTTANIENFRAIRKGSTDAVLSVNFEH